jgi:hypothetical protein
MNIFKIFSAIKFFKINIFLSPTLWSLYPKVLDKVDPLKIWRETCMKTHLFLSRYGLFLIKNVYSICIPCSNNNSRKIFICFKTVHIGAISYVEIFCESAWFNTSLNKSHIWIQHYHLQCRRSPHEPNPNRTYNISTLRHCWISDRCPYNPFIGPVCPVYA